MRCMTPLGVKGHIKVRVRVRLVLVNLIMEQIKPYIGRSAAVSLNKVDWT